MENKSLKVHVKTCMEVPSLKRCMNCYDHYWCDDFADYFDSTDIEKYHLVEEFINWAKEKQAFYTDFVLKSGLPDDDLEKIRALYKAEAFDEMIARFEQFGMKGNM